VFRISAFSAAVHWRVPRPVFLTSAAEPVVRHLLAHDPHLSRLEVRGAGLEEAFLTLTRHDDHEEAA